jgi:DNA-binding NtrC family response regulator
MRDLRNSYKANSTAREKSTVVVISQYKEDHGSLDGILGQRGWPIRHCTNFAQARSALGEHRNSIIVTERRLPDGNWKEVLEFAGTTCAVIVACQYADEQLWAEVLNVGGYDLLLKPFNTSEVSRVIAAAARVSGSGPTPDSVQFN